MECHKSKSTFPNTTYISGNLPEHQEQRHLNLTPFVLHQPGERIFVFLPVILRDVLAFPPLNMIQEI